jgi:hypothetical protein
VAEPFRDEMSAALTRAEKLAEENQDLKRELERLRETAHAVRALEPDHPLAAQTLAVLDRLEEATHVDALAKAPAAPMEADHADPSLLTQSSDRSPQGGVLTLDISKPTVGLPTPQNKPLPPPPPRPRRNGLSAGTLIIACFVCLFVGIMLGAMIR